MQPIGAKHLRGVRLIHRLIDVDQLHHRIEFSNDIRDNGVPRVNLRIVRWRAIDRVTSSRQFRDIGNKHRWWRCGFNPPPVINHRSATIDCGHVHDDGLTRIC